MRTLLTLLLLSTALGCSSYKDDLQTICDAPTRSGGRDPKLSSSERVVKIAGYIKANIKSSDASRFMRSLASANDKSRTSLLRAEAVKHGIPSCELADFTDDPSKPKSP